MNDPIETHACDLISRQAAIDAVDIKNLHRGIVDALQNILSELPSAQQELKKGKWILINGAAGVYECDQCHERVCCVGKYCMNCGAIMEEQE